MSQVIAHSIDEEAVAHAYLAERSGDLMWRHIESEYTQDVYKIAATLATDAARVDPGEGGRRRRLLPFLDRYDGRRNPRAVRGAS